MNTDKLITLIDEEPHKRISLTSVNEMPTITYSPSFQPFLDLAAIPSYILYGCLAIGITGMVGNLFVFSILVINISSCKNITEKLILHQTIIDGMTSIFLIVTTYLPPPSAYSSSPSVWDDFICRFWATQVPLWMCFSSSCFNLVAITFEQYFQIVYPIFHKVRLQTIKVVIPVCLVWFFSVIYNVMAVTPVSNIVSGVCLPWSSFPNSLAAVAVGVSYLLYYLAVPAIIMICCFCHMIYTVHKKTKQTAPVGIVTAFTKAKLNMMKTLILFGITYVCCWSYNIWVFTLGILQVIDTAFFSTWPYLLSGLLLFSSCSINPFLYAINCNKFRKNLKKSLHQLFHVKFAENTFNASETL